MKIEQVKRQVVKPASTAAASEREWVALSTADLLVPPTYVDCLFAYAAPAPQTANIHKALAKALEGYREFAGRIEDAYSAAGFRPAIVLNDVGVAFIEAVADVPLRHLQPAFQKLSDCSLLKLIPGRDVVSDELLLVQVTRFTCGGMAVGCLSHHRVADAAAAVQFFNAWALASKGQILPFSSSQDRSLMMARDPPQPKYDDEDFKWPLLSKKKFFSPAITSENHKFAVRKLYFSAQIVQKIKEEARKHGIDEYTRFESLTGHLWRCITRARVCTEEAMKGNNEGVTRVIVPVNARTRMNSKMEGFFGNAICRTCASANIKTLVEEPLGYAAKLVRQAVRRVNEEYVRSSLDFGMLTQRDISESGIIDGGGLSPNMMINSWASIPFNDVDFGNGRPIFAGKSVIRFEGLVIILSPPAPEDGGYNVALALSEAAMENFLTFYDSIL